MTRYILLRTCETDFDLEGRIKGTLDLPLNKHGHDQAIDIARELSSFKVNAVYYSASQSSAQTADALSREIGIKPKQLKHLHNLNHGLWQGKRVEELREKQKKAYRQWQESPESACPPEGEMLSDAQSRVKSTLDKLTRKHKNHIIVVVAPEPLYSLMCSYLEESELGDLWETICAAGSWRLVDTERLPLTTANHS